MSLKPDIDEFSRTYDAGEPQLIWSSLIADLDTPVSAMMKLADGRPNSFLLESVEGGEARGRYSFIGLKPDLIWRCQGPRAEINRNARFEPGAFVPESKSSLDSLRDLIAESRIELPEELPPMAAGLVGYLGYDMVRVMERLPEPNPDSLGTPDGLFLRPTIMAVFDSVKDIITVVTPVRPVPGTDARTAYGIAAERISDTITDLERSLPRTDDHAAEALEAPAITSNTTNSEYHAMVERAKEYIRAGDIFQVVPSQRFSAPFTLPPLSLYRALRRTNPSPYMYFLNFEDFAVVGSSPEILVRVADGKVTIRPLAGTRPRGATNAEDKALEEDLLGDEKELAEHLMLLDLGRNDVGRVAKTGTVKVTERNFIERYSHVMHIVSNVDGEIDPKFDAVDALVGGFPAGTVSGAPKIRAMEIIDELEKEKRGIYAGTVGYFSAGGTMDTCIVLRTAIVKDGRMYVQAGGGVVYDSVPENEFQETRNKSMALVRAAEEAVRYAERKGN